MMGNFPTSTSSSHFTSHQYRRVLALSKKIVQLYTMCQPNSPLRMARGRGARRKGRGTSTSGSSSRGTRSGRDVNTFEPEHEERSKEAPPAKRRKDEESSDEEEAWEEEGIARWRSNILQSIETANYVDMSFPKKVKNLMWVGGFIDLSAFLPKMDEEETGEKWNVADGHFIRKHMNRKIKTIMDRIKAFLR